MNFCGSNEKLDETTVNLLDKKQFILKNLNVEIKKSQLIGVIGTIGSGKTSFLNVLLGEVNQLNGKKKEFYPNGLS
jgi:ABC-type multidrug transport system ATPase subunit